MDINNTMNERYGFPLRVNWAVDKKEGPDKQDLLDFYCEDLLLRIMPALKINGLPDTIPAREFKLMEFTKGKSIVTDQTKGQGLLALWGNWAPPMDAYYHPKNMLIANPWANINKSFQFYEDKDCVLIRNDSLCRGILPIVEKYANHIMECDISIDLATINLRDTEIIAVANDEGAESAREYLEEKKAGRQGIIIDEEMTEKQDKAQVFQKQNGSNYLTQLMETRQYWYAQYFNELGLNANFNMKREAINSSETDLNEDGLRPLIDDIINNWREGFDKVNAKYGTNITVEFDSSWYKYNADLSLENVIGGDSDEKANIERDAE